MLCFMQEQLGSLMDIVDMTEPHFIRCIKPNPQNEPDRYDRRAAAVICGGIRNSFTEFFLLGTGPQTKLRHAGFLQIDGSHCCTLRSQLWAVYGVAMS